ncbi:hypothetical protein WA158_000132 [Blastocystis sp. Blastoise]
MIILLNYRQLSFIFVSKTHWRYSTKVDTASWKENNIEEWGEDYINKEIKNAGITTYFRKDITVDDLFAVLQLSIQSQSGFIVYINGIQISSKINENTPSLSIEEKPTYKQIIIPKNFLVSSTILTLLKVAIELHTTENHKKLASSYNILGYFTNNIGIYLHINNNIFIPIDYLPILSPLSIR